VEPSQAKSVQAEIGRESRKGQLRDDGATARMRARSALAIASDARRIADTANIMSTPGGITHASDTPHPEASRIQARRCGVACGSREDSR
jgi:hypothetical protein